jgi:hypothetical protein
VKPLQDIIHRLQLANVKQSCDETHCFTDIDYKTFTNAHKAQQIANDQRSAPEFRTAAMALRGLPEAARQGAEDSLRQPLRKTWEELGEISCKGQTVAGKNAERDIANALVDAALEIAHGGTGTSGKKK